MYAAKKLQLLGFALEMCCFNLGLKDFLVQVIFGQSS